MSTYVIASNRGLWRIDRDADEDFDALPVERPECPHCGHRETARLLFEEIVVDPTDGELAGLEPKELDRFGMTREQLLGLTS